MRIRSALLLVSWAIAAMAPAVVMVSADQRFRVVEEGARREGTATVVSARVYNSDGRDAVDVYVTAEALNASGAVLATGIAFVSPLIRGRSNAAFTVKVPFREGEKSFRLSVSSYREGVSSQAP